MYGITAIDIARQVRQAFFGEEVQRIQRADDDIKVMLKLPKNERDNLVTLENMRIRTPQGIKVPLYAVANVKEVEGKATIVRVDGKRVVEVTSDVDVSKNTSSMILQTIVWPGGPFEGQPMGKLKKVMDKTPGVDFALAGEPAEQSEQLDDILL